MLTQNIWKHRTVVGHTGDAYGLASCYFYSGEYTVAYAISGSLNGYKYNSSSIFAVERQMIHDLTSQFVFGG
jgi:hypothetical protein